MALSEEDEIDSTVAAALSALSHNDATLVPALKKLYISLCRSERVVLPSKLIGALISRFAKGSDHDIDIIIRCLLRHIPNIGDLVEWPREQAIDAKYVSLALSRAPKLAHFQDILMKVAAWSSTAGFSEDLRTKALAFEILLAVTNDSLISGNQLHVMHSQISEWLQGGSFCASLSDSIQVSDAAATNKGEAPSNNQYHEIDGSPGGTLYTVLNTVPSYTSRHVYTIHSFSSLKSWILHARKSKDSENCTLSDSVFDHCLRITEQWERKPKFPSDFDVQCAALMEAVEIMDHMCKLDISRVPRIIDVMKRINTLANSGQVQPLIILQTLQFFLNHSAKVVHDPQSMLNHYFDNVLSTCYSNPVVAFKTLQFVAANLEQLCYETTVLVRFFPNLLKLFAWDPKNHMDLFVEIFPAMMNSATATELLHSLLDLPCVTAVLEALQSEPPDARITQVLDIMANPINKPLFNFITRNESGHGDTIDKLSVLHAHLMPMSTKRRVIACSDVIPDFLEIYFRTILQESSYALITVLISVMIERLEQLYAIPVYQKAVRKCFASYLVKMVTMYPQLLTEQKDDFVNVCSIRDIEDNEDFPVELIWCIGEHYSLAHEKNCTSDVELFESLECMLYELTSHLNAPTSNFRPRSLRRLPVLMMTITKLASRCQDLIPRVLLCLTKICQLHLDPNHEECGGRLLVNRANDLINLLKLPDVAWIIFNNPGSLSSMSHHDNFSIPVMMQMCKQSFECN